MDALKKVIGVVLIIIAAIVAIHTVIEPLYHTSTEENPYNNSVWAYINILSAISIVLGVILSYSRMSQIGENSSVQEFIAANTLFYGFMFAAILFFWNWFGIINPGQDYTPTQSDTGSVVWIIFDALLPLLNGALGAHLLRSSASE
jgi:Na+/proline symporter